MLKRIINLTGSMLVGATDSVSNGWKRLMGRPARGTCIVLAYHSVTPNQRSVFAKQMDLLLRAAKPIHADLKALPAEGGHFVAVTFDDGLDNILENALPELKQRGIPATLFIVTEMLGCKPSWENMGGDDASHSVVMSEEQLSSLPSELVKIGSHTMTHPLLPATDKEKVQQELLGSRLKLEKMLGREVKLFSFPYGAFNNGVIEECRTAGYERVFTALPVFAIAESGEFVTGRVGTAPTDWPIEFRLKLAGAYRWLPYAYEFKRRVMAVIRRRSVKHEGPKTAEKRAA